jgi:hypothetical protein
MEWNSILDPTRNEVTAGSVMPADGSSIAGASTGTNVARQVTQTGGAQASGGMIMPAGNLVIGMVVFVVLIVVLMFVVHKWGGESGDFSNIRASAYNVLVISLIAVVGIPVIKVGMWKLADLGLPGADHLATWALAA